jgi:site-specific DNA recombinase
MHKRAVLYARVSTDDQADRGYSLPSQLDLCRKYAERLGYTVIGALREDCSGATPIAERPEGKWLVAKLKRREADVVIAYQVDRLSRDIVDLLATVRSWLRMGVEVHACDIGKIESELDIVLVIKGWQGSDERKKIVERTLRGKYAKARAGKVVGAGRPLYGYQYVDDALVIVEHEACIVRLIYVWYTEGDGDSKSLSIFEITKKLSEARIPTPGESRNYKRIRASGIW